MFRFPRIVLIALFVALSSVAVLAQSTDAPLSKRQKLNHKLKITSRYNQSSDTTVVRFLLKEPNRLSTLAAGGTYGSADAAFGEDVAISSFFSYPGKQLSRPVDEATIWVVYTGGPRTAVTNELSAIVDGRELVLSRQVYAPASPDRRQGANVRSLTLPVTRDQLTQMANASKVTLVLPSGERVSLTREQLNALADFTSRMSP